MSNSHGFRFQLIPCPNLNERLLTVKEKPFLSEETHGKMNALFLLKFIKSVARNNFECDFIGSGESKVI